MDDTRFLNEIHCFPRNFPSTMLWVVLFIASRLMGLSMQALNKQEWTEFSWRNNVYNAKFSLENTFRTWFCHRIHVYPMIITVSTLLSLLQLITRFKLHVVKRRKLTLFSCGNSDQPTRISANVRIKHDFSMNFTHFHEVFLQQRLFIVTGLMGLSIQTLKKQDWTGY